MNEIPKPREIFESYSHIENVIQEHKLEPYLDRIKWHMFDTMEDVTDAAQQIIQTFNNLTSGNIPAILDAKVQAQRDYLNISSKLYVFAREQGRAELGLTNDDVTKIFASVEIGGAKYCTREKPQNTHMLFD